MYRGALVALREGQIVENHLDESIDRRAHRDRRPTDVDELRRRFSHHAHADQPVRIGVDNQLADAFGDPRDLFARVVGGMRFPSPSGCRTPGSSVRSRRRRSLRGRGRTSDGAEKSHRKLHEIRLRDDAAQATFVVHNRQAAELPFEHQLSGVG